ncbi:MAG: hypothetical protein QXT13_07290 [Pyrobaculum sp.]
MRATYLLLLLIAVTLFTIMASAGIDCKSDCTCQKCCIDGQCSSGRWSGTVCGCGEGDPQLSPASNKCGGTYYPVPRSYSSVDDFMRSLGYCRSWYGGSYSDTDYTKRVGKGYCRYQAIVDPNNFRVIYRDGPEPNPQPAYFCNGNPDLWWPWGCERNTIEEWHRVC